MSGYGAGLSIHRSRIQNHHLVSCSAFHHFEDDKIRIRNSRGTEWLKARGKGYKIINGIKLQI